MVGWVVASQQSLGLLRTVAATGNNPTPEGLGLWLGDRLLAAPGAGGQADPGVRPKNAAICISSYCTEVCSAFDCTWGFVCIWGLLMHF